VGEAVLVAQVDDELELLRLVALDVSKDLTPGGRVDQAHAKPTPG
jgi:hypothetical protein